MKGRSVSALLREIDDILEYEKLRKSKTYFLQIIKKHLKVLDSEQNVEDG